jgi:hypothetical protein
MRARKRPAVRKRLLAGGESAPGSSEKQDGKIVLDERAQKQPADRRTAQRSGRPTK